MSVKNVKRILVTLAALTFRLLVVLTVNAFLLVSPGQFPWEQVDPAVDPRWIPGRKEDRARLQAEAIRIPTVWSPKMDIRIRMLSADFTNTSANKFRIKFRQVLHFFSESIELKKKMFKLFQVLLSNEISFTCLT